VTQYRISLHQVPGHGLLATSPALFAHSSFFIPTQGTKLARACGMTNRGIDIELDLTRTLKGGEYIGLLTCRESESNQKIGIYLTIMDDGRFVRTRLDELAQRVTWSHKSYQSPSLQIIYVPQLYQGLQKKKKKNLLVHSSIPIKNGISCPTASNAPSL